MQKYDALRLEPLSALPYVYALVKALVSSVLLGCCCLRALAVPFADVLNLCAYPRHAKFDHVAFSQIAGRFHPEPNAVRRASDDEVRDTFCARLPTTIPSSTSQSS